PFLPVAAGRPPSPPGRPLSLLLLCFVPLYRCSRFVRPFPARPFPCFLLPVSRCSVVPAAPGFRVDSVVVLPLSGPAVRAVSCRWDTVPAPRPVSFAPDPSCRECTGWTQYGRRLPPTARIPSTVRETVPGRR